MKEKEIHAIEIEDENPKYSYKLILDGMAPEIQIVAQTFGYIPCVMLIGLFETEKYLISDVNKNELYQYHKEKFLSDDVAMNAFENLTGIKIPEEIKIKPKQP